MRFLADSMLGRLAKWLRIMGYDTLYQSYYPPAVIDQFVKEGLLLLSRHKITADKYTSALLLHGNSVGEQLAELKQKVSLTPNRLNWFTRCLICNTFLKEVPASQAKENLPEYIYFQNISGIRLCPSCGRYYWPGSHRARMVHQLEKWDFGY